MSVPVAMVRAQVSIPLRLHDGLQTTARAFTFTGLVDGREHLALGLGCWADQPVPASSVTRPPLTRLHSECLTGDVLGSRRCDCGPQLQ